MKKKRMQFVPALQEQLRQRIPAAPAIVDEALRKWHANEKAASPLEAACFGVFQKVQADIEADA